MNKISFKGSAGIIKDFAARFLCVDDSLPLPGGRLSIENGEALRRIAEERYLEAGILEKVIDFLEKHGVPEVRIKRLMEDEVDELVELADNVDILRGYMEDGTIMEVKVIDEWPLA